VRQKIGDYFSACMDEAAVEKAGSTPLRQRLDEMAQWACGDERAENKRHNAVTNEHSPNEHRINGVVVEYAAVRPGVFV
jgi:predicted metalloendopeptidase